MTRLVALHDHIAAILSQYSHQVLPTLARLVFAGVLVGFFWNSAMTKLGPGVSGLFLLSPGAYIQIVPGAMMDAGFDPSRIPLALRLVALLGTWAEFVLPFLVLVGLATRLSALGMIGFIVVMSWVDIHGHGVDAQTAGALFDRFPGGLIWDQRALWVLGLLVLVFQGGGPLSADALLRSRRRQ